MVLDGVVVNERLSPIRCIRLANYLTLITLLRVMPLSRFSKVSKAVARYQFDLCNHPVILFNLIVLNQSVNSLDSLDSMILISLSFLSVW